jgi:hypothetical protein
MEVVLQEHLEIIKKRLKFTSNKKTINNTAKRVPSFSPIRSAAQLTPVRLKYE